MPETPHSDCSWRISGREVVVISSRKTPLCGLSVFDADVVVVWMPGYGAQRRSAVMTVALATVRIAAVDEHAGSPEAPHIRECHRLIVQQEVRDGPWHSQKLALNRRLRKPLEVAS